MPRFDDLADRCANLAADISLDRIDAERVGWLGTLIGQYEREHDWDADIDPSATMEMIRCSLASPFFGGMTMNKLPETLTFSNPRSTAEFNDWPSGRDRVQCKFYVEHDAKRGYRVCRQTTDRDGKWCKPKTMTYSGLCAIVDGSDGKTYILQIAAMYGFVSVWRHDFMTACDAIFEADPRHWELMKVILQGQPIMSIRNLKITFGHTRIVVYPEGGFQVERFVSGPGWILDTDPMGPCEDDDARMHAILMDARAAIELAASKIEPARV